MQLAALFHQLLVAHVNVAEQARVVRIADDAEGSLVGHVKLATHGDVAHESGILHVDKMQMHKRRNHAEPDCCDTAAVTYRSAIE